MPETAPKPILFALCQHDFDGTPLFHHRIHDKWTIAGVRNSLLSEHEELCAAFVDELTNEWNPASHLTRHLTRGDQIAASDLVGQKFQCERIGQAIWPLVLGENNRIAEGWTNAEFFWWCESNHLVLAGIDGRRSYRLAYRGDGDWSGQGTRDSDSSTIRLLGFEKKERNEQQIEAALI